MERLLRPEKFNTLHTDPNAEKKWKYWKRCFNNFLGKLPPPRQPNEGEERSIVEAEQDTLKLELLINYVEPDIYEYFCEETQFGTAMTVLDGLYEKPVNIVYARHLLSTQKQEPGQSIDSMGII